MLQVTMPGPLQRFKADFFKALAHPTRIRILELLRDGEKSVTELQLALGAEGAGVSQQLAILRMKNLVDTRRAGTSIYYRLRDPQISQVLDAARRVFDAHVIDLRSIADAAEEEAAAAPRATVASPSGRRRRTSR
jgi:DNA-binding transcriptional ArsR family regulator